MDNRSSHENPQEMGETNSVPILPTTLKALKIIAADYRKKGIRPIWRTTQFQYLAVVARIVSCEPKLVLNDNTAVLVHQINKRPIGSQLYLRHQYYRFIFQITPYSSDSLSITSVKSVSAGDVLVHLSEVVEADLKCQMHAKNNSNQHHKQKQTEDLVENCRENKQKVLIAIANWKNFTLQDLEQQITCEPTEQLNQILLELLEEGKIGDMGNYYMVNSQESE